MCVFLLLPLLVGDELPGDKTGQGGADQSRVPEPGFSGDGIMVLSQNVLQVFGFLRGPTGRLPDGGGCRFRGVPQMLRSDTYPMKLLVAGVVAELADLAPQGLPLAAHERGYGLNRRIVGLTPSTILSAPSSSRARTAAIPGRWALSPRRITEAGT